MNPTFAAALAVGAFAAGVIFHRYVISEAAALKAHVDQAEYRISALIRGDLKSAGAAIANQASKL